MCVSAKLEAVLMSQFNVVANDEHWNINGKKNSISCVKFSYGASKFPYCDGKLLHCDIKFPYSNGIFLHIGIMFFYCEAQQPT